MPVAVVQSRDDGKAREALKAIAGCGSSTPTGYAVTDGWVLVSDSQGHADQVAAAAGQDSLADDATYQQWNDRLGDAGVVNMYAAPKAGVYLARGSTGGRVSSPAPPPGSRARV